MLIVTEYAALSKFRRVDKKISQFTPNSLSVESP